MIQINYNKNNKNYRVNKKNYKKKEIRKYKQYMKCLLIKSTKMTYKILETFKVNYI